MTMRIMFITGLTGGGKTIGMTFFALAEYQSGKKIFTNYRCQFSTQVGLADLIETLYSLDHKDTNPVIAPDRKPKVLCLDEVHTMWDSYRSFSASALDIGYFADQHRKINCDILYTSQHPERIHKSLRGITTDICYCESIPPNEKENPIAFRYTFTNRFSTKINEIVIPTKVMRPLFNLYDTYQRIVPVER